MAKPTLLIALGKNAKPAEEAEEPKDVKEELAKDAGSQLLKAIKDGDSAKVYMIIEKIVRLVG